MRDPFIKYIKKHNVDIKKKHIYKYNLGMKHKMSHIDWKFKNAKYATFINIQQNSGKRK